MTSTRETRPSILWLERYRVREYVLIIALTCVLVWYSVIAGPPENDQPRAGARADGERREESPAEKNPAGAGERAAIPAAGDGELEWPEIIEVEPENLQ